MYHHSLFHMMLEVNLELHACQASPVNGVTSLALSSPLSSVCNSASSVLQLCGVLCVRRQSPVKAFFPPPSEGSRLSPGWSHGTNCKRPLKGNFTLFNLKNILIVHQYSIYK